MIRALYAIFILIGLASNAHAAPVDVVKIISFGCTFCRASEAQDRAIEAMVVSTGGRMAYATIPDSDEALGRELMYYTVRNEYPLLDRQLRETIFEGAQDESAPLENAEQAVHWLSNKAIGQYIDTDVLLSKVNSEETRQSLRRAISVTQAVGASQVPTYVILKNGQIEAAYDITAVKGASYLGLKELVIDKIKSLAQ